MKKITKHLFSLLSLLSIMTISSAEMNSMVPMPKVVKVNDYIYALLGPTELPNNSNRGYMVNSTVVVGDKGVILIDTGFTDEIGHHIKNIIATITNKPVTHIINTHNHGDHTLGNSAFENVKIISSEKCKTAIETNGYEWIGIAESTTGLKLPNTKPVVPTVTYAEGKHTNITLQGVKFEFWVPAGSHTPTDMMVLIPKYEILIAGDILVDTIMPSFRDGHVKTWISTLKEIGDMKLAKIIPGHGNLMTTAEVRELRKDMIKLYDGVEVGYKKGLTDSEIRKTLDLSEWTKRKHFDELMGTNINRTYLEVEEANF
ncbi:MAG: MBL fold metallo-hydrolase [Gammaproteobacteria bacterium]|nr:MBL fold metallo-hydrolase [Gammaproteobacteria bacterium]